MRTFGSVAGNRLLHDSLPQIRRTPPNSGFRFGNAGRNTIIGPGVINWDFSMLKEIRFLQSQSIGQS